MGVQLDQWTPEIEREYKEVLYRFMGEIQSTKAALYLKTPQGSWGLATQYGFGRRDNLSEALADDHPLVRMAHALSEDPCMYNDPSELGSVTDYLAEAGTNRLMLVPLASTSGLLGFVDVRDKGRQRPFNTVDLDLARAIGAALTRLTQSAKLQERRQEQPAQTNKDVVSVVVARGPEATGPEPKALYDDFGLEEIHAAAADALVDTRIVAVALTLADSQAAATLIQQRGGVTTEDTGPIQEHQIQAMEQASVPIPRATAWKTEVRRVTAHRPGARMPVIASSVVLAGQGSSLVASVIGDAEPAVAKEALERIKRRAKIAHDRSTLRLSRRGLARRLLQPGDRRFPELMAHSLGVSRLCWSLARGLGLDEQTTEEAALAGLLHDVGMRELDYDRLYMHPTPGPEDRRTYRMHVEVGDRIVRVDGFQEIADAVRHHHERWDGNGYPDQLTADAIPLLARMVHVAEVYDLFTSANSYRPAVSRERALAILSRAAGHQFDPNLVEALTKVVA
jgi:HD-GYP domain-containing protein (c-di-GMP phosphodiesterase class II)